jgi:uncharacterized protein
MIDTNTSLESPLVEDSNNQISFLSPSKGHVGLKQLINEIAEFIKEDSQSFYSVIIGSDSQAKRINGQPEIDFVTAVVVHRRGKGARYFWRKEREHRIYALQDKIRQETSMSVELAGYLVPELRKSVSVSTYDFEIHVDVGPIGPTREMIKEVVGWVTGMGYTVKTKPESYGASSVADKHT